MNAKARFASAALASAAALTLLVTGCGDTADSAAPATAAPATPAPATTAPGATQQAAPAGASVAKVDGKTLDGNFETTCAKQGGILALALTDLGNPTYGNLSVSATIEGADTVQAVAIAGTRGGDNGTPYAAGYGNGQPGGTATLTKDGETYTVTGEGVGGLDPADPMAGPKTVPFEITFACDTVVNG